MTVDWLIRGGTVVDGTGAPARRADVALAGDRVVDLAPPTILTTNGRLHPSAVRYVGAGRR